MQEVEQMLAEDEQEDVGICVEQKHEQAQKHGQLRESEEKQEQSVDDNHYPGHAKKEVEEQKEQPAAEQDEQVDSDTAEEEVAAENQRAEQSGGEWGYSGSVEHVWPVEPEPELDATQRYLEDSGP